MALSLSDDLRFRLRCLNRGLFNPTTIRHRSFDGHIPSAKTCGSHWIKYMLSLLLAELFDLPAPEHIKSDAIIGHPKHPPIYPNIPRIVLTHSIAHHAMRLPFVHGALGLPRYIVLVRDIRHILVSVYEKWDETHRVDFPTYLRGDLRNRSYATDIWQLMRFFNAWGAVVEACPDRTMVLRYEDLTADARYNLAKVCTFLGIEHVAPDLIERAVTSASKQEMAKRLDPREDHADRVVNPGERDPNDWFGAADRDFLAEVCRRNLKYNFGYDLG